MWDERVAAWEEVAATPAFAALQQRVFEEAEPVADDVVVDLGAGTGLLTLALAPYVRRIIAVDISPSMLTRLGEHVAEARVPNVSLVEADLRVLPLEDDSVTLAVRTTPSTISPIPTKSSHSQKCAASSPPVVDSWSATGCSRCHSSHATGN